MKALLACLSHGLGGSLLVTIACLLAVSSTTVSAASDGDVAGEERRRPKIGLVLSGGGARGAAHIGVLKALEEMRIPIDYIAGTSMGSIIGGLYASGLSPEEMETWITEADWYDLLEDDPPRAKRPLRTKVEDFNKIERLEVGFDRDGFHFPSGMVRGQKLTFELRRLTLGVATVDSFDDLAIPFRAVATRIATGEKVVLSSGSLPDAMRASMAVPGVFSPWTIDGELLSDGFITSNLPIKVVQEMGADIVIAVDVRPELKSDDELNSALALAGQMFVILSDQNTLLEMKLLDGQDVYVHLPLPGVSSGDFVKCSETIQPGYDGMMGARENLSALAVGQGEYGRFLASQRHGEEPEIEIAFVRINKSGRIERKTVERLIKTKPGAPLDVGLIDEDLQRIYGLGDYELVEFRLVQEGDEWGVEFTAKEKKWGPGYVRFGIDISSEVGGQTDFNILLSYRLREINRLGAEWFTQLNLGDLELVETEFYQPLEYSRTFFVAPSFTYIKRQIDATGGQSDPVLARIRRSYFGLDVGVRFGSFGELRVGAFAGGASIDNTAGVEEANVGDTELGYYRGLLRIDSFDSAYFPRKGVLGEVEIKLSSGTLGGEDDYARLTADFGLPVAFETHTLLFWLSGGARLGDDDLPIYDQFPLGGFLNLSGLRPFALYDQYSFVSSVAYYKEVGRLPAGLGAGVYAGFSLEAGNVWADSNDIALDNLIFSGSLFLGAETIIGPLYLGLGATDAGDTAVYFSLGRPLGAGF